MSVRPPVALGLLLAISTPSIAATAMPSSRIHRSAQATPIRRSDWFWSSIPLDPSASPLPLEHARLAWYNPPGVTEGDLNPALTKDEEVSRPHTVLELNVTSNDSTGAFGPRTWTGVTHSRSRSGEDLSATQFVEIWVNDRRQGSDHLNTHVRLHYDIGRVSEDAFWDRGAAPNGRLDSEDKNRDTKLDRSDDPTIDEDTGLDGLHDTEEPGYDPGANPDPNRDDYHFITGSTDYSKINNMERNGVDDPNARPDTEDLNLDGILNPENDYYEATIDLADTLYVAVDVARDYAGDPDVKPDNGWRLFRIPVSAFTAFGNPSWSSVQHERVWLDGLNGPANIQIGGIQILPVPAAELPKVLRIRSSSPNPFRDRTTIHYDLPAYEHVRIAIYDLRGRLVKLLRNEWQDAGAHSVTWSFGTTIGRPPPSGIYFCRLEAGGRSETRRIVLVR